MGGIRAIRFLRGLLDVQIGDPPYPPGDVVTVGGDGATFELAAPGGGGGGAPVTADYLVGTAQAGLSAEVVVGATPGGELGGTWAAPTVDAVHSGSSHAGMQAAAEATAAAALAGHDADTTNVHGIADTSVLATDAELDAMLAQAVILAPAASARNVIQPTLGSVIAAIIKAHAAQSVDLTQWQSSAAAVLARMTSGGDFVLGSAAATGAGFQFNRAYSNPADLFKAFHVTSAFTQTDADEDDWYAAAFDSTLDGTGGTQSSGLSSFHGLRGHVAIDTRNADPLAYETYYTYGLGVLVETLPTQTGNAGTIFGGYLNAMHNGAGSVDGLVGFQGQAVLKGSPVINPSGGFTFMVGLPGGVENTSDKEVEVGAALEAIAPYIGGPAGSRFTNLLGLRVNNQGDAKVKTSYGIRIDAQSGASIRSYALAALGGKSLFTDGLVIALLAAPADAAYANGEGGWWWDQAAPLMKWKGKDSGGTVVNLSPYVVGGADVAVADGGTGASTAAGARTNLGISATNTPFTPTGTVAATDVQAAIAEVASEAVAPNLGVNTQTASYTLVLTDATKLVELNVASANTLTVPPNASVAFPTGTIIRLFQYGAGRTTVTAGAGVTIRSRNGGLALTGQYSWATLIKRDTNEWDLSGDVSMTFAQQVLADTPRGYWKLNEASGTSIADSSGNALTGTKNGSPTMGVTGPITGDTAITFASGPANQWIEVTDNALLDLGDICTLECWYKRSATQGATMQFVSKGTDAYSYCIANTNRVDFQKEGVADLMLQTGTLTDTASWHHLVVVKDGSTIKLFIDGSYYGIPPGTNATLADTATNLFIAKKSNNTQYLDGTLAHVAVYPVALSDDRVLAHYKARA